MSSLLETIRSAVMTYLNHDKKLKDLEIQMQLVLRKKGFTMNLSSFIGLFKPLTDAGTDRAIALLIKLEDLATQNLPHHQLQKYLLHYASQQLSKGSLFGSRRLRLAVLESIASDLDILDHLQNHYADYVSACAFAKAKPDPFDTLLIDSIQTNLEKSVQENESFCYLNDDEWKFYERDCIVS